MTADGSATGANAWQHTLCDQNASALTARLEAAEQRLAEVTAAGDEMAEAFRSSRHEPYVDYVARIVAAVEAWRAMREGGAG